MNDPIRERGARIVGGHVRVGRSRPSTLLTIVRPLTSAVTLSVCLSAGMFLPKYQYV